MSCTRTPIVVELPRRRRRPHRALGLAVALLTSGGLWFALALLADLVARLGR